MSTIEQQVELLNTYKQDNINQIELTQQSIGTCESTIQRNYAINESMVLNIAQYEEEIAEIEANNLMLDEMIIELESLDTSQGEAENE